MATTKTLTVADVKAMLKGTPVTPVATPVAPVEATPKPAPASVLTDDKFNQVYGEQAPATDATDTADKSNLFLGTIGTPVQAPITKPTFRQAQRPTKAT